MLKHNRKCGVGRGFPMHHNKLGASRTLRALVCHKVHNFQLSWLFVLSLSVCCKQIGNPMCPCGHFPYPAVGRVYHKAQHFQLCCPFYCHRLFACKQSIAVDNNKSHLKEMGFVVLCGTPIGNRTLDSAVRGRRLDRLTMRAYCCFCQPLHNIIKSVS